MGDTDYSRDSERIILELYEQGQMQTRPLVEAADLPSTQAVHYRYNNYLGPDKDGLVEKAFSEPGKQSEWRLTEPGKSWAESNLGEIRVPQTEDEAVDVAARALEKARSAESTAGTTAGEFDQLQEDVTVAVGEAREAAMEALDELDEVQPQAREAAREQIDEQFDGIMDELDRLDRRTKKLSGQVDENKAVLKGLKRDAAGVDYVEDIEERVDEMETNLEWVRDRVDVRKVDFQADMEDDLDELEQDLSRSRSRRRDLEDRVDELEEKLKEVGEKAEEGVFDRLR